jgi:hypothetical protein
VSYRLSRLRIRVNSIKDVRKDRVLEVQSSSANGLNSLHSLF